MIRRTVCFVVIGLILCTTTVMAGRSDREKAAIAAAEKWLTIVDKGKYIESWEESSEYFKQAVTAGSVGTSRSRRHGSRSAN